MATRDIEPLGVLDRATKLVETDTLHSRGVNSVRILSESKFFEIVRELVEDYLEESVRAVAAESSTTPSAPHDEKLSREYQRRWDALRTKHEIGIQQIQRRMDRLSRVLRRLEGTLKRVRESEAATAASVGASGSNARPLEPAAPLDKKTLMREMLLGDDT